jgi:exopolyphosphatase / guanosine-5'-triphosphate,3'-diphosphate pyrophosphatase
MMSTPSSGSTPDRASSGEVAIIDLGSNTARLAIYAWDAKGIRPLYEHDESERLRLIDDLDDEGNLTSAAIESTVNTVNAFRRAIASARVPQSNIVAVATSALRSAANRDAVLATIHERTGINLRVLLESEEAAYACDGVRMAMNVQDALVFDLGGGGLQVARMSAGQTSRSQGFVLGTLRLLQRFPNFAPMSAGQLEAMRLFVAGKFAGHDWLRTRVNRNQTLDVIGIGGTVRALARMDQTRVSPTQPLPLRGYVLTSDTLEMWVGTLSRMTMDQLLALPGLQAGRADMVLFGAIVVRELLSACGAKRVTVCDTSIRDGLALAYQAGPAA